MDLRQSAIGGCLLPTFGVGAAAALLGSRALAWTATAGGVLFLGLLASRWITERWVREEAKKRRGAVPGARSS